MARFMYSLVQETTNAPGNSLSVTLNGAVTGYRSFGTAMPSGTQSFYVMREGANCEWGIGTYTAGSPDTFSRDTPIGNTAGTTGRLSFTGTTRIYCELPAENMVYIGGDGIARLPTTNLEGNPLWLKADNSLGIFDGSDGTTTIRSGSNDVKVASDRLYGGMGYCTRQGSGGGYSGNKFNLDWAGGVPVLYIDSSQIGRIIIADALTGGTALPGHVTIPDGFHVDLAGGSGDTYFSHTTNTIIVQVQSGVQYLLTASDFLLPGVHMHIQQGFNLYFDGASGQAHAYSDGASLHLVGYGNDAYIDANGISLGKGFYGRYGTVSAPDGHVLNFVFNGSALYSYVDTTNIGQVSLVCDPRVKNILGPAPDGAGAEIDQVETVRYTLKDVGIFHDDGFEHLGFDASNLHTINSQLVTGSPDAVDADGNPVPMTVLLLPFMARLTKALQETRVSLAALQSDYAAYKAAHP